MANFQETSRIRESIFERFVINPRLALKFQLIPFLFWMLFFFFIPILIVLFYSFCQRGHAGIIEYNFTLENYARFITQPITRKVIFMSLATAVEVTIATLLVAFIPAYYLATTKFKHKVIVILLLIVPFWTSILVRTYSWILILGREGILNVYLLKLGIIKEPLQILYTQLAVVIGLVHTSLPFMIMPIFSTIDKLDFTLVDAAKNLGASPLRAFWKVTLPLSMQGIAAGCILVFIWAMGAYISPALLGGSHNLMIAMFITQWFLPLFDWPFGSAATIIYLLLMVMFILVYNRLVGLKRIMSM